MARTHLLEGYLPAGSHFFRLILYFSQHCDNSMDIPVLMVVLAWFAGGFISGASGIGGAMIALPIAALFIPIQDVIALSCILNLVMDGMITAMHFRHCKVRALFPLFAGAIPGSVIGLFILQMVPGSMLQGMTGVLLLLFVLWQIRGAVKQGGESWIKGGLAGFASGVLGSAISFDGPPVGAYGLYAGWAPRVFLGTLGVFFIIRASLTCVLQAGAGLYTPEVLRYAAYGLPATVLGTLCAFPFVKRINPEPFRKVLQGIIAIAAIVCIWRAWL